MTANIGGIKAFFGLDPTPAVKGMHTATKAVKKGSKQIDTSLRATKRLAITAFSGWGIKQLATDFAKAAMDMDSMRRSMSAAVGGMEKGRKEINFLRKESQKMGLSFKDSTKDFKMLAAAAKGTALEGEGIRKVWKSLQNATVALQLTTAETSGTVYAFKDMLSKGTVQSEELKRQLGNRLPGAFRLAANAMNMTTNELRKQMELGKVMADDFLPALARELDKTYGKAAVDASKTMRAEMNRMKSAWFEFQALFMETTGLADTLAMSMKYITKTLVGFNDGMDKLAKFVGIVNLGMVFWMDNAISGFITLSASAQRFANTMQLVKSIVSFFGKGLWIEFKYKGMDALDSVSNSLHKMIAGMKEDLANFVSWTAEKMSSVMPKAVLQKLTNLSDALRSSASDNRWQGIDQTQALKKMKEEALKTLEVGMTTAKWKEKSLEITKKETQEMKKHKALIKEGYESIIAQTKERLAGLKGRKDMPEGEQGIKAILGEANALKMPLTNLQVFAANLSKSFTEMSKNAGDVAKNISDAFTSAFNAMSDALTQMIIKGKVDWRSLADSMIADMVRIAVKQAVIAPLMMAFSQGMSALSQPTQWGGTGVASASTSNASGSMSSSWATYDTAAPKKGISEATLNPNQIKASPGKGVAVNVQPVINISTPPGTEASTQQSSDGMNIDVMVSQIEGQIAKNARRGSVLSDTFEGLYGVNRANGAFR